MHEQTPTTRRELRGRTGLPTGAITTLAAEDHPPLLREQGDATVVTSESVGDAAAAPEAAPAAGSVATPEPADDAAPAPDAAPAAALEPEPEPAPAPAPDPARTAPASAPASVPASAPATPTPASVPASASAATPAAAAAPAVAPAAADPRPTAGPASPATATATGSFPALQWVDPAEAAAPRTAPVLELSGGWKVAHPADLLAGRRRRRAFRPATVIPALFLLLVLGVYTAATLLWPLTHVTPTAEAVDVTTIAAPEASPAWPAQGSAAVSVGGISGTLASSDATASIASITKVVTALLVLDRQPLAPGEQGRDYAFTAADSASYWQYRARGESSLDVPVGGTLTQLQMLQGMLIGSANNYADRLASDIWPTDADFADAAAAYLAQQGIDGITIADPTGIEAENRAAPGALVPLAEKALANPVIAGIVSTQQIELPGAGLVRNGNPLLADPGVVGVKTGTLDAWNLLSAKDIVVGDTTVRAFAAVLGQPGPDQRNAASRALFAELEQELQLRPSVVAGTVVGRVSTLWGDEVDVVTTADASVVLWNGATATATTDFALGDARETGESAGSLTVAGPLDADTVDVRLNGSIEPPSVWWRLTHPLDLLGVNG